jgi:hypothetical protein
MFNYYIINNNMITYRGLLVFIPFATHMLKLFVFNRKYNNFNHLFLELYSFSSNFH